MRRQLIPLAVGLLSAVVGGIVGAIAIAVIDISVTGTGGDSLLRPMIEIDGFVSLSVGDLALLVVVLVAGGLGFRAARPS